ncbi:MAG: transketolase [Candidatus Sumerlaeia bacterium]
MARRAGGKVCIPAFCVPGALSEGRRSFEREGTACHLDTLNSFEQLTDYRWERITVIMTTDTPSPVLEAAERRIAGRPLFWKIANTIRFLSADAVQRANSGHPGMPMGCADLAAVLWTGFLRVHPQDPGWLNRDRFVLSAGHGSMLLYSLLHLAGFPLSMDDLKRFRQWGSPTPGHPEFGETPGVETTTGPLGQGFANGVGMAVAAKWLGARFNTPDFPDLIAPRIFAIVSDGDLMEGVSAEAASFAGHYALDNLIYIYDDNKISIDGPTELSFSRENVAQRFKAYGWHVQSVDGHDPNAIEKAIRRAIRKGGQPHLIMARTTIGFGSPGKANTPEVHGSPLGPDELKRSKENLGWPVEPDFFVPDDVRFFFLKQRKKWARLYNQWQKTWAAYQTSEPARAADLQSFLNGKISVNWDDVLKLFPEGASEATRKSSGKTLAAIYHSVGNLIGGSADLTPSNNTHVREAGLFTADDRTGRYIHFGVREHAMGGLMNGMSLFGGVRPYGGTFLVFSDYMRPSIRLAAIMRQPVIYVFTHDSVFLGEDGPTHQPIEHLAALRVIPNLTLIRPADGATTAVAWKVALERRTGPTALALTRQNVPALPWSELDGATPFDLEKGAFVLSGRREAQPRLVLIASGSETHLALEAWKKLKELGVSARVIDVPSWQLFDAQPEAYRQSIFPAELPPCLLIEAAASQGWERYLGRNVARITIDGRYGASAPAETIARHLGFTVEAVLERAKRLIER